MFDPPTHLLVHEGAAEGIIAGSTADCSTALSGRIDVPTRPGRVCDQCPVSSATLCLHDSEVQNNATITPPNGSPTAMCLGIDNAIDGHNTCSGVVPIWCTAASTACRVTADCPTYAGGQQTCVGGTSGEPYAHGLCRPDNDGVDNNSDTKCPTGYADVGNLCRRQCGRCSVTTTRLCSVDADCPAETCVANPAGANKDCGTWANNICNTTTPRVCKGRATCPCDRATCTVDSDCPAFTGTWSQLSYTGIRGQCVSGRCANCGILGCPVAGEELALAHWHSALNGHRYSTDNLVAMQAVVNTLSESDGRPLVIFSTEGPFGYYIQGSECDAPISHPHVMANRNHYKLVLPRIVDYFEAVQRHDIRNIYGTDWIHYASPTVLISGPNGVGPYPGEAGQEVVAVAAQNYLLSLNTCAQGTCRGTAPDDWYGDPCGADADCPSGRTCTFQGLPKPIRYCRSSNRAWTSTVCASSTDCSAGQSCSERPCVASCSTDRECRGWYGNAHLCVSGTCRQKCVTQPDCPGSETCSGSPLVCSGDSCSSAFGTGYAAVGGVCKNGSADACPAALDACNAE